MNPTSGSRSSSPGHAYDRADGYASIHCLAYLPPPRGKSRVNKSCGFSKADRALGGRGWWCTLLCHACDAQPQVCLSMYLCRRCLCFRILTVCFIYVPMQEMLVFSHPYGVFIYVPIYARDAYVCFNILTESKARRSPSGSVESTGQALLFVFRFRNRLREEDFSRVSSYSTYHEAPLPCAAGGGGEGRQASHPIFSVRRAGHIRRTAAACLLPTYTVQYAALGINKLSTRYLEKHTPFCFR